jgi:NTP pyrophosphatase (non-canonical NTP hydrolase)
VDNRAEIILALSQELDRAYAKHGNQPWGRHEFYGILLEEVEEMWDAIKGDEPLERVHEEALQVACVVIRFLESGERYGFK